MEDIINVNSSPNNSYYQSNQSQFYTMARIRHRQDVLNRMQQTFDTYSKGAEIAEEAKSQKNPDNNEKEPLKKQDGVQHNYNNSLNLGNIADILSGNGDISKTLIKLLSGKNKDFANLVKIMDNPMLKQMFTKQQKKSLVETSTIDNKFLSDEIDKLEKVVDN